MYYGIILLLYYIILYYGTIMHYGSETWCLKENEKAILRRTERAM